MLLKENIVILIAAILTGCSLEPKPISYGQDQCAFCKMTITDARYGSELITKKGKIFKFDSAECLIDFVATEEVQEKNIHSLLITDFATPENFTDAKTAHYLISQNLPSPMGADLTGFHNKADAEKFRAEYDGRLLTWGEVTRELTGTN